MSALSSFLDTRSNINTRYVSYPLSWFLETGGLEAPARYQGREARDAKIRIPEHQRDYVWKLDKQQRPLIDTVMRRWPIPNIIMTEGYHWHSIQDGQQRMETLYLYYTNQFSYKSKYFKDLTEDDKKAFLSFVIPVTDITGATLEEEAEIYDRLNKGVSLSHGEKFWNRRSKPLVALAERLFLTRGQGFSGIASEVFGNYLGGKDQRHNNLANAMGFISGAAYGVTHISTSYDKLAHVLERRALTGNTFEYINEELIISRIAAVLNMYKEADAIQRCQTLKKKKAQWKIGLFSSYMLYSVIRFEDDPEVLEEIKKGWVTFLCKVRVNPVFEKLLIKDMAKSNNLTIERLQKGYENLEVMMENGFQAPGVPAVGEEAEEEEEEEETESDE